MKKIIKNKLFWIGLVLVVLIVLGIIISCKNKTKEEVMISNLSLVTKQAEMERDFRSSGYTLDNPNVVVNPYGNSPLTALVMFETEEESEVEVTIKGKDKLTTFNNTFEKSKEHYLPIYGLYADKTNEVVIKVGDKEKVLEIKTDKLPDNFILPSSVKKDESKLTNDLYFYTPSSIGYTCAYDVNGDVRWYLTTYALWDIERLNNGHLLLSTERLVNSPYYMTGLYEMDLLGKVYNEYSLPGGYHHDYFELENGNLLVASDNFDGKEGTVEDYIVELDRKTGNIVKKFDLKDVLNMNDGPSDSWTAYDWFHNNAVWYDKATNSITLSGRHKDAVVNIDYETGKLNWIIGDSTNWNDEYQKYFFKPAGDDFEWQWSQHAAMITPEGYVFIFDNGNNKSKIKEEYVSANNSYSRGVMYKIDTDNMTIEQVWEYGKNRGKDFYSPYISDVDYIDSNHYIVHSGGISYDKDGNVQNVPAGLGNSLTLKTVTVELLNDKVIFELTLPTNTYRVEKMSLYNECDNNYKVGKASRLGTLGVTVVNDESYGKFINIKDNENETYLKYKVNISREEDRLIFKGQFLRGTDVNIILNKGLVSKYYHAPVSKKPYTALCLDIFTEEETENGIVITKYINKEGLEGKYNIYLEVDGVVYNTNYYVEF